MLRVLVIFVFVEFDVRLVERIFVVWIAFAAYTLLIVTKEAALETIDAFMVGAFTFEEAVTTVADIVLLPAIGPYKVVPEIDEAAIVLAPAIGPYRVEALTVLLPASVPYRVVPEIEEPEIVLEPAKGP
jgi:hypothetical protein